MNPEVKARWLAALRSGDYVQGSEALHDVDASGRATYCCLGVLCALAWEDDVVDRSLNEHGFVAYGEVCETAVLPDEVATWAGLPDCDPTVAGHPLSGWNDGITHYQLEPVDFDRIAQLIEEHL